MEQLLEQVTRLRTTKVKNGRKQTTGKYDTREELVSNILRMLLERRLSKSSIARVCKVSPTTVESIIESLRCNV